MALPISAFIITKNEEARLARSLAALRPWVDEIVVVDSGSTDRTVDIARSMGARVLHRDWSGYGGQKRFAEQQCRNDWVLNVDADEVVTPELADEIRALFRGRTVPEPGAYRLRILTVYPGDEKPRPFAKDYNIVRLYHRSAGSYRDHPVFDRVVLNHTVPKQLRGPVFHHSYLSFAHIIEKNNQFSSFRSRHSKSRATSYLVPRLGIEFPLNFLKYYIFRRHLTGGWKGYYFSLCHAFMRTSRVAKMLEAGNADAHRTGPALKRARPDVTRA
ncbi:MULTISPECIES: glycosyltransferase family 2 protein [Rhodomicrobium]|uniref:glycosyltransferase family 2 protein n=1 Tax=Rhodomicrobium TaxID=1068 RepID=UPI001AECB70F|nr:MULTISPECIES: glycosyltransferase family 2 protein [Rhodomicrobium]